MATSLEASLRLRDQFTAVLEKVDRSMQNATKSMQDFKQKVSGPAQAMNQMAQAAAASVNKLNSSIKSGMEKASNVVKSTTERILSNFGNFGNRISGKLNLSGVTNKFTSAFSSIQSKVSSGISAVGNVLSSLKAKISGPFNAAVSVVQNGTNKIKNFLKQSGNSFKQFGSDMQSGLAKMQSSATSASGGFKSMVAAIGVTKLIGAGFTAATSGIKSMVGELNSASATWKVFQGNMSMFGKSDQEIATVKKDLQQFAQQTIYSASDMAGTYSQLAAVGTKNTTALVKGFGGLAAAAEDPSQAMKTLSQQATQMAAKPAVQWMDFKLMLEQTPAGIAAIAKTMGMSTSEMVKSVQDGKVATEDFFDAIAKTGTNDAFTKMATEFKTVEQAMDGLKEGLTNKLQPVFDKVSAKGIKFVTGISDRLEQIDFEKVISNISNKVSPYLDILKNSFNEIKEPVAEAVGAIKKSLDELTGGFGSEKSVDGFKSFVENITEGIKKLANFAEKHSDSIAKLITILPKVAGAFLAFKIGKGVLTPFLNFGSGILTITKGFGKLGGGLGKAIGGIFKKLPGKESVPGGGSGDLGASAAISPLQTFLGTMNSFAKGATTLALVFGVIKLIEELAQALKDIDTKVPKDLSTLGPKMLNMGIALTGMGAFVKLAERFSKDTKGAIRGLAVVAGISGDLILAAVAMQQINNRVPDDIGSFASKMANMGIAMGGMGVLVLAAGKLASMNPTAAIAGLAVVAGISLELMLAAEAMKQVNDKVPDDIGNFASKVANMAIAIGGMGVLVAAVGALTSTGIGALIGGAGLLAVAALAGDMMLVAEAIAQMDAKIPEDLSSVKTKIDNIAETIGYFTAANLGGVLDLFSNAVGVLNVSVVTTGINKFAELAIALQQFDAIEVSTTAGDKIKQIQKVVESIAKSNLGDLISNGFTAIDTSIVIKTLDNLIDIGNSLTRIDQLTFDVASVKTKIKDIQSVIDDLGNGGILDKIGSIFGGKLDTSNFGIAKKAFNQLIDIGNSLVSLQGITFEAGTVKQKVKDINSVIEELGTSGIGEYIGTMIKGAQLGEVKASLDAMNNLIGPITQLATAEFDVNAATTKVNQINEVIKALGTAGISEYFGTMLKSAQLGEIVSAVQTLIQVRDQLNTFASGTLNENVQTAITAIKTAIQQLSTITAGGDGGGLQGVASGFSAVTQQIASFTSTAQAMAAGVTAVGSTFQAAMTTIKTSTETTMTSLPQVAATGMAGFQMAIAAGMILAAATARSGSALIVSAFSGLRGQLQSAGMYAMSGLAAGINAGAGSAIAAANSVANQVAATVRKALDIHSPSRVMMAVGGFVSAGLAKGITAAQNLVANASNRLATAAVPSPLADVSASGNVTSTMNLDQSEVESLKASSTQTVVVQHKQVVPQVVINVDNKDGEPIDTDALLQEFEDKIIELMDSDLE